MKEITNILTRQDLRDAVKRDTKDHEIKALALLLIDAMRDWPTNRSDKIEDFIRQFKAFHRVNRRPLDLERVNLNKFAFGQEHNLWRLEAHSYIKQMMEMAVAVYGISDLDIIVDRIVRHYERPTITSSEDQKVASHNAALALRTRQSDPTLALAIAMRNYEHPPHDPIAATVLGEIFSDRGHLFYHNRWALGLRTYSLAFSPDSQSLLTGGEDEIARLWTLEGQEIQRFKGRFSVAFSPDGAYVLTDAACLWDLEGREVARFDGNHGRITTVTFLPDGKHILIGSRDRPTSLWDLKGKQIRTFDDRPTFCIVPLPKGNAFFSVGKTINLMDMEGRVLTSFPNESLVLAAACSPDGQLFATLSRDKKVRIFDRSASLLLTLEAPGAGGFNDSFLQFSPDGAHLLIGKEGAITMWNTEGKLSTKLPTFDGPMAYSPDGHSIAVASWDGHLRLWAVTDREPGGSSFSRPSQDL